MVGAGYLAASVLDKLWTDLGRFDVCLSFLVESHRHGGGDDAGGGVQNLCSIVAGTGSLEVAG